MCKIQLYASPNERYAKSNLVRTCGEIGTPMVIHLFINSINAWKKDKLCNC